jgi:hypothetical protein
MRGGRLDGAQSKRGVTLLCTMIACLFFLFVYFGSFFGSKGQSGALEYGTKFSRSLGWGTDDDGDSTKSDESIFENAVRLNSFPVS